MTDSLGKPLKESEIRPEHLMGEDARRYAEDIRRLLEKAPRFVSVACPACRGESEKVAFLKMGYRFVTCQRCQTMYVNPRPTSELLEDYYRSSQSYAYWNEKIFPASEPARREKIFRPRAERVIEFCRKYQVGRGLLLEAGAGFGTFCEEVRKLGHFDRVIAVEPMPELARTCRGRGLEVFEKRIEDVELAGLAADVIVSFEVIEHLFSPREFLTACHAGLKVGGLMVLTCPNVKGFDILILQELSKSVDPEHLNYFHPTSLSLLAADCGFEALEALTPGKLDVELVRAKALTGEFDISRSPFLRSVLIEDWEALGGPFQQFLSDSGLSSHLWMILRKKG